MKASRRSATTSSGPIVDLPCAVSAHDVAVATQPEVAVVVAVGLVGAGVLASVEFDHNPAVRPEAVDGPGTEALVAQWKVDPAPEQELAKAAFQVALDLAMARGMLFESGAQVGAARMAASERAPDVIGAQVVLELGFGEGSQQRVAVVAGREVQ